METFDRTPPYAPEAEVSVLSAMMMDREAALKAFSLLAADHFYREAHRRMFGAMAEVFESGGSMDPVTLMNLLRSKGELDAVGGAVYLTDVMGAAPTSAFVEDHCKLIEEKAILRGLIEASTATIRDVYEPGTQSAAMILDAAQRRIFDVAGGRRSSSSAWIKALADDAYDTISNAHNGTGEPSGLMTGFVDFDTMTTGLHPGDFVIVAARPSMGKTAWAMNVATNVAIKSDTPVAIFSLEMTKEKLVHRIVCSEARVDSTDAKMGKLVGSAPFDYLARALGLISKAPIWIDDSPTGTTLEIKAKARRMEAEMGLGLIVVDYIQLMSAGGKHESRQQEVTEISRGLKAMARELSVPVIALSQLSRAPEARADKRPYLSDLRESGSLEQDADIAAFLYRPEYYFGPKDGDGNSLVGAAELIIAKQRDGATGTIPLFFHKEYVRFDSADKRSS